MKIFSSQKKKGPARTPKEAACPTTFRRGFTVLLAVVVSALVLAIGLSIANITLKQILLSSSGRESQIAFYIADSGAECALYYDLVPKIFPDSANTTITPSCGTLSTLKIVGSGSTEFEVEYGNYCAKVTVRKTDVNSDGVIETTIDSRGYNTLCDSVSSRRLERGIRIDY